MWVPTYFGTMDSQTLLVWVTTRQALNAQAITCVFHGKGGQVIVNLSGCEPLHLQEQDLTAAGRELLLPPSSAQAAPPPRIRAG